MVTRMLPSLLLAVALISAGVAVAQPGTGPGTGPVPCGLQSGWPYYPPANNQPYLNETAQTIYTFLTVRPFAGGNPVPFGGLARLTVYGDEIELKVYFNKNTVGTPLVQPKPSTQSTYLRFNFFADGTQNWKRSGQAADCNVGKNNLQFAVRWGQNTSTTFAPGASITFSSDYSTVFVRQKFRNTKLGFWHYNQGPLCNDGLSQGGPFNTWELGLRVYKLADQEPTVFCGRDNVNSTSFLFRLACGTASGC